MNESELRSANIDIEKIKVLGNKERLKILELLKTRGSMSWSDLYKELNMNPNSLNFHLSKLLVNDLVGKRSVLDDNNHARTEYTILKDGFKFYDKLVN